MARRRPQTTHMTVMDRLFVPFLLAGVLLIAAAGAAIAGIPDLATSSSRQSHLEAPKNDHR